MTPCCVLTIAGSDSGGGAGVQADCRTIHALGGFAVTAITAVTAQNTRGVVDWQPVAPRLIAAQINALLADLPIKAIKTGLIPTAAAITAIGAALKESSAISLVIDPVIRSTSGAEFLAPDGVRALRDVLFPGAALVTPNWPEAEILSGTRIRNYGDAERAAHLILSAGCRAVLIKGGHAPGNELRDVLVAADGVMESFRARRIETKNTHGTGCVLASAIATRLAQGAALVDAIADARKFLRAALERGKKVTLGHGHGPALL